MQFKIPLRFLNPPLMSNCFSRISLPVWLIDDPQLRKDKSIEISCEMDIDFKNVWDKRFSLDQELDCNPERLKQSIIQFWGEGNWIYLMTINIEIKTSSEELANKVLASLEKLRIFAFLQTVFLFIAPVNFIPLFISEGKCNVVREYIHMNNLWQQFFYSQFN